MPEVQRTIPDCRPIVPATGWGAMLRWYDPLVAVFTRERRFKAQLLRQASLPSRARVLDVGCGSGTLAIEIHRRHPSVDITAIDADQRILNQARRKSKAEGVRWSLADALALPFGANQFEAVFCSLVTHHLCAREKQAAFDEMRRVLVPGGRLHLADFCRPASPWARRRFLAVRLLDGFPQTACNLAGRLPGLLRKAGFTEVRETLLLPTLLGSLRCYEACNR